MKPDYERSDASTELERADEERLKQLFESTAAEPDGPTLTKLAARALDIPEREQRLPRWLPHWAWSPTIASLVVAFAALAVIVVARFGEPSRKPVAPPAATPAAQLDTTSATGAATAPSIVATNATTNREPSEIASSRAPAPAASGFEPNGLEPETSDETELVASGFGSAGADSEGDYDFGLGSLDERNDEELDAWLAATQDMVGGG